MSPLEARYRRLLACYPREHRARHEEEMIGVLLAAAGPGREHPDPREVFDVVKGGILIRLQRSLGPEAAAHWRDALNVAAIVAPLHLLVLSLGSSAPVLWPGTWEPVGFLQAVLVVVRLLPYPLILGLALRGSRWAAAGAWIWAAAESAVSTVSTMEIMKHLGPDAPSVHPLTPGGVAFQAVPGCVVALLLTLAPRPAEGAALIGHRRLLHWSVAAVLSLAALNVITYLLPPDGPDGLRVDLILIAMACGVASRTPVGRRAILLMVPILASLYAVGLLAGPLRDAWPHYLLQTLLVAVFFTVARRGFRPYGSGTVSSPERLG
ncbi:hypothetical protein [Streptosporangium sp. NBC_01756]|uniref:hypothetical protein n=1 Tax=Streptosporangium sp. NBC_01756 TaxID=2975950 RepID=UPI002DDA8346|nr:hypothetical protein [Streptosporangium sp. NBC_01756]WSC87233.1 hypothetical protein OIE48_03160 [Streptosporangium sp. NBC_01756]